MTKVGRLDELLGHSPRRIVALRALVIGDLLCAVPALRALRHAYPQAHVALIGLPWAREFVRRFSAYLDEFIEFPGFPGLPERAVDIGRVPHFLSQLQQQQFDVALQMHGSGSFVNPLCELMGARVTAGFYVPGEYCPSTETFLPYPEDVPEVRRHLALLEFLGIAARGEHLELPLTAEDDIDFGQLTEAAELREQPYVCLHPGARYLSRRWHAERFAGVGDALAREGFRIVVTGTSAEAEVAARVVEHMQAPAINLAGRTSLGALAVLLKQARLLISNDTGVSHVAAALRAPSVVVVTGSDPARWAPLDRQRHRTVMGHVDCRPCDHLACPIGFLCADAVSVEEVVAQSLEIMNAFPAPASVG